MDRGSEVTVTVQGPGGQRDAAEVDTVARHQQSVPVGGEAQAGKGLGGRIRARRHVDSRCGAGAAARAAAQSTVAVNATGW